ncbi:MAG: pitrilysin family protein [Oscillospiraceae bacterium]
MDKKIIQSERLGEEYIEVNHKSGLKILLYPMKGYSTTYALFGTKYGSLNTTFKTQKDDDFVTVPEGIAHYLEHKLFESEDGVDAFDKYAKTGACANAYTSFDKTCYLFACSDNFKQSLEILLDTVTHPYFTPENVEKERGIIGQEIQMYDDDPNWRVYFNLLSALYVNHPLKIDIAGTTETIAKIDAPLLYRCYNTFYNLHNMVLTIAGNFSADEALEVCDRMLETAEPMEIENKVADEPNEVCEKEVVMNLPVSIPMFQIGYKGINNGEDRNAKDQIIDDILIEIIAGETTELYSELYKKGIINGSFGTESMAGFDYNCCIFSGESEKPYEVQKALNDRINSLKKDGISDEEFARAKKNIYGKMVGILCTTESVASVLINAYFSGFGAYELLEFVSNATKEKVYSRLTENIDTNRSSISVIMPADK